ncbi:hypothetical protein [Pseudanabaena mucicola]|uniref:TonB-dependent receptor n=1 Tax=Pseudanabaena mucicola FACHB-723 TaxID=2692860 RepID=A0ABR8A090_9CYAN|nr:hypothetical protein [Pseudanabaena mucicola]MBD2188956.1 hypothetical protein [Pseudanabaena mucicola FACHB-723]
MNRHYQYIAPVAMMAIMAISAIAPAFAQSIQPRRGDADQLRPAQGQPISPTNQDQFAPNQVQPDASLQIQNIELDTEEIQPVIPGNYNASPQRVNKSGTFSSDPLNAILIFQDTNTSSKGN